MSAFRPALCAAFAASLLLAASPAEARFGKKSSDTSENKKEDKKRDDKRDNRDARVHAATPIRSSWRSETHSSRPPPRDRPSYSTRIHGDAIVAAAEVLAIAVEASSPGPSMTVREQRDAQPLHLRAGLNGGVMGGGVAGDAFLGIEGEALGIAVQGTQLVLPTDDGTRGTDDIRLATLHLTYAPVSTDRVRWRLEGGVSTAHAPDVFFVGPSIATSLEVCVAGPLDLEARVQGTAGTYRQVDASAGLALHLGALNVRGGVRGLILDDAGRVDGIQHVDSFVGPYAGVGLAF
ncbi:hypothetical protein COCOR_00373 [Corallococcus coralloides DSM 2259]|uniref:Outer membrane protein beta-barrel domain-containing protein n=1 Tax=Corallococcus coralloides (strain ATCC 25202 / DSM 2259 / NBRC 100086 / M2) TaxID=1144275 RepID=H8MZS5_CORCM|nr:hypothetical protein [Corallococcus coralloides]AFE03446.1 hypothetical protein COCOR_00373 [Corallococcus coralloides DSM 2259]